MHYKSEKGAFYYLNDEGPPYPGYQSLKGIGSALFNKYVELYSQSAINLCNFEFPPLSGS